MTTDMGAAPKHDRYPPSVAWDQWLRAVVVFVVSHSALKLLEVGAGEGVALFTSALVFVLCIIALLASK